MDKFAALTAFTAVVEEEGFAPAARRLGASRSAVNRMVINLEDRWGVQLLNRTTRRVAPTATGKALYERARALLDEITEIEAGIRENHAEPVGDLRLNAPMSFGILHLAPAIADFMTRHPGIRTRLTLTDRFVDIVDEGYDLTIRIAEPREDLSLVDHRICPIRRVLCAAPSFLATRGPVTDTETLSNLSCLHYGTLPAGNVWRLNGPAGPIEVPVQGAMCADNGEVLRDAAVRGLGIALLPTFIVGPQLQTGELVTILADHAPPDLTLCAIYPPSRHLSAKINLFVDFVYDRFGGSPYWDLVD